MQYYDYDAQLLDLFASILSGSAFETIEFSVPYDLGNELYTIPLNALPRINPDARRAGKDWPLFGLTMIGDLRLYNIDALLRELDKEGIQGDFMECGVWRGGASIYAQLVIALSGNPHNRSVWLADSFEGLPLPRDPSKDQDYWSKLNYLKVSLQQVQLNMAHFQLLPSSHIHYCKGYFHDSLLDCHPSKIALLRMDGDMYESTMDQLYSLYPYISLGGRIIVDDWSIPVCQRAMRDFWSAHNITPTEITRIDDNSMYWMKTKEIKLF